MMRSKKANVKLQKTFVVLINIVFLTFNVAYGADAPGKSVKQTQALTKPDPGEWKKVVDAAKKEGRIVISGAPGEEWRRSLVDMFQQEYPEIIVEFSAGPGRNFWPRVRQERELGKKLWDLRLGGPEPAALEAKRDGTLAPIRPLLLPEIADDGAWIGGVDGIFIDREKRYMVGFLLYVQPTTHTNRDFIKESELKSSSQMLDQKFKGKIVILTPTGGSSLNSLSHMASMYGKNFIHDLLSRQEVIITDDNRQQVEWVVRGKYPICIGLVTALLIPFEKQGLGKNIAALEDNIIRLTTGTGGIFLLEGAPHPNATRVYINWLLSRNTQAKLTKIVSLNSRRTDVPVVDKQTAVDPEKLSKYRFPNTEEDNEANESMLAVIKEALKK